MASYFLVIVGFSMMTAIFALLLFHRFGLDALHTGYILAGIGILGVIIQGGLIGRLVRRFGEAPLALVGAVFMCLGLCGLALSSGTKSMFAATAAVGIGNSLLMPTLSALASRSAEASWQGRALGVMQSGGSLARWVGPMVAGLLLSAQLHRGQWESMPFGLSWHRHAFFSSLPWPSFRSCGTNRSRRSAGQTG